MIVIIINYTNIAHFHDRSCSMRFTTENTSYQGQRQIVRNNERAKNQLLKNAHSIRHIHHKSHFAHICRITRKLKFLWIEMDNISVASNFP